MSYETSSSGGFLDYINQREREDAMTRRRKIEHEYEMLRALGKTNKWDITENFIKGKTSKMNSITSKIRNVFRTEPNKSLHKAGIINDCNELTSEGRDAFIEWLFEQNKTKFTEEVIKPILEEEKENK